jgi:hypothetical protein
MSCIIKINPLWLVNSGSFARFDFFYSEDLPIAYLNEVGDASLKWKDTRNKITVPIVSFSTNDTKNCIKERAAKLAHKAGYWGHIKIFIGSYSQRGDRGSEITICMFYLPGDSDENLSTIASMPERVDISKFFSNMDEERMRKNLIITEIMMT